MERWLRRCSGGLGGGVALRVCRPLSAAATAAAPVVAGPAAAPTARSPPPDGALAGGGAHRDVITDQGRVLCVARCGLLSHMHGGPRSRGSTRTPVRYQVSETCAARSNLPPHLPPVIQLPAPPSPCRRRRGIALCLAGGHHTSALASMMLPTRLGPECIHGTVPTSPCTGTCLHLLPQDVQPYGQRRPRAVRHRRRHARHPTALHLQQPPQPLLRAGRSSLEEAAATTPARNDGSSSSATSRAFRAVMWGWQHGRHAAQLCIPVASSCICTLLNTKP